MLYNTETKKIKTNKDCLKCKYFDKKEKKCTGLNKRCFEFDAVTGTLIDGVTKLSAKI